MGSRAHKTVIAGTGRCGTTCLIQLLTRAELDTGLKCTAGEWKFISVPQRVVETDPNDGRILQVDRSSVTNDNVFYPAVNAGCEILICPNDDPKFVEDELPEIIKDSRLAWCGHELIDKGILSIRHMIVCIRDLKHVAASKSEGMKGHDNGKWYQHSFSKIYDISAWQIGVCVAEMTVRKVPITFLEFPRFVEDKKYFLTQMSYVFYAVKTKVMSEAWDATVNPKLVHYK